MKGTLRAVGCNELFGGADESIFNLKFDGFNSHTSYNCLNLIVLNLDVSSGRITVALLRLPGRH